jgi:putative N6-adenine-specific DNA methylase
MVLCAVLCDEGLEDLVSQDLQERYAITDVKTQPTIVLFSATLEECANISYTSQAAIKVLYGVSTFEVSGLDSTVPVSSEAKELIKDKTIAVQCVRKGEHLFNSVDFAREISEMHFSSHKKDFKKAEIEVLAYIKNSEGYFGVDITGRVLSKRDYKIFFGPTTLRGTIGYGLLLASKAPLEAKMLDPFMGSGTIILEAALRASNTSPFFFTKEKFLFRNVACPVAKSWDEWFVKIDSKREMSKKPILGFDSLLKYLKYTQKNAKIADINKVLTVSKCDIDWLDTKLDEESIDVIITHPPAISKNSSLRNMLRLYVDFFKQSDYLLQEEGWITLLASEKTLDLMLQAAKKSGFKCTEKLPVFEGKQAFIIARFERDPDAELDDEDDAEGEE